MDCHTSWPLAILCLIVSVGCSDTRSSAVTAAGTITAEGVPLSGAVVTLEPLDRTTGPNASVPVFDGKFEVPSSAGLHGGKYRVRVSMIPAELRQKIPAAQSTSLPPVDAVIAPAFDAHSRLTCDLKPDQRNSLTFEVEFLRSNRNTF